MHYSVAQYAMHASVSALPCSPSCFPRRRGLSLKTPTMNSNAATATFSGSVSVRAFFAAAVNRTSYFSFTRKADQPPAWPPAHRHIEENQVSKPLFSTTDIQGTLGFSTGIQ